MRFSFGEDQLALRDTVRGMLERECPAAIVRAAWTNETGRTPTVWARLGGMGVLGALVDGATMLDLVLVFEETGRAALPEPVVEHAAVGVPLGLDGDTITAALDGPSAPWAASADTVVVLDGGALRALPRAACHLSPAETVDRGRPVSLIQLEPGAGDLLDADPAAAADRGALAVGAQLLGLSRHLLDVTVQYAKQRRQFGAPIGSFQAVQHALADVALGLEFAAPLVYRAAYSMAVGDSDTPLHVAMAKHHATEAAQRAARAALQVHGAVGYSFEHDLHLWMKRVWALASAYGDPARHRARLACAILDP